MPEEGGEMPKGGVEAAPQSRREVGRIGGQVGPELSVEQADLPKWATQPAVEMFEGEPWGVGGGGGVEVNPFRQKWQDQVRNPNLLLEYLLAWRKTLKAGEKSWNDAWRKSISSYVERGVSVDWLLIDVDSEIRGRVEAELREELRRQGKEDTSVVAHALRRIAELVTEGFEGDEDRREFEVLDLFLRLSEEGSPEGSQWGLILEEEISGMSGKTAERYLKRKLEEFRVADMLGELPIPKKGKKPLLSPGVDFRSAMNSLARLMKRRDIEARGVVAEADERGDELSEREDGLLDREQERLRMLEVAALAGIEPPDVMSMGGAMRDLASYVFEPEMNKVMWLASRRLDQDGRNQWVARLTGAMIRAGRAASRAGIYLSALGGDENASSIESAIAKGQELVERISAMVGYIKPEQLHSAASFFGPEEIAALNETPIKSEVWFDVPDWIRDWVGYAETRGEFVPSWLKEPVEGYIQRTVEICPKDVLAVFYNTEVMRELLQSQAMGDGGYWETRGKWFEYAFWLRVGMPGPLVKEIVNKREERPQLRMTNQLTMTTRRNVDSMDMWLGENWWMVMEAEATLMMTRSDYGMMPIDDFARRLYLGLRKEEQADYWRRYDLGPPFLQEFGGITYLPDYFSIIAEAALVEPLQKEAEGRVVALTDKRREEVASGKIPEMEEASDDVKKLRKKAIKGLVLIDQVSPAVVRELSKMALGLDDYWPEGVTAEARIDEWKKEVVKGMKVIDKTGGERLRLPELWKDVTAEHLSMTDDQLEQAWKDFDFSDWLSREGLSEEEVASGPVRGIAGWERFKRRASLRLMEMSKAGFREYDRAFRYLMKVSSNEEALFELFQLNFATDPIVGVHIGEKTKKSRVQIEGEISGAHRKFIDALVEVGKKLVIGDFVEREESQRMYRAVVQGFRDTNCAWSMDTFIEDIDVGKVGGGSKFSVRRLDQDRLMKRWGEITGLGDKKLINFVNNKVIPFLAGYQMYFVQSVEMESEPAVLIGPNTAYVPDVVRVRDLYRELKRVTGKRINERKEKVGSDVADRDSEYQRLQAFMEVLRRYEDEGYLCWSRLRDGASSMLPEDVEAFVRAVDKTVNINVPLTDQLLIETNNMVAKGEINGTAIVGDGWRFKYEKPGIKQRFWRMGYPLAQTSRVTKFDRSKRGRYKK